MKIQYDREADAVYIEVRKVAPHHVIDIPGSKGFSVDVDEAGQIVGIEILHASQTLGESLSSLTVEDIMTTAQTQS